MKNRLFITGVLLSLITGTYAQTDFTKATKKLEKIDVKLDFPPEGRNSKNGKGYSANVELLNPKPKKVALISYYLYDPANGKVSGSTYTGTSSAKVWRTSDALGQQHVDGMYAASIKALKQGFKDYNIDLLTPEEFLDTPEKEELYYGFNQESAKKEKTSITLKKAAGASISSVAEASVTTLKVTPSGAGYRAFFVANERPAESDPLVFATKGIFGSNRKMTSSLGYELSKGLGVDAVVVAYIVTRKEKLTKNNYGVNAAHLFMFGPNPMADDADDDNRGQFYCGTRVFFKTPALFHEDKPNQPEYDGFNNLMLAMAQKTGNWVLNKEKK